MIKLSFYNINLLSKTPAESNGSSTTDGENKRLASRQRASGRPKLLKRYTFQEKSANAYAVNNLQYDLAGEVLLSPKSKSTFAFQDDTSAESTEFDLL